MKTIYAVLTTVLIIGCAGVPSFAPIQEKTQANGENINLVDDPSLNQLGGEAGQKVDLDGDKKADGPNDGVLADLDEDGIVDTLIKNNGDQIPLVDTDGDGIVDGIDSDNDGTPDGSVVYDNDDDKDGTTNSDDDDDDGDGVKDEDDDHHGGKKPKDVIPHGKDLKMCGENDERGNKNKVTVCHVPPGNPDARKTLCIGAPAVNAHLNKGSYLGECK